MNVAAECTVTEAAALLNCCRDTVYRLMRQGEIRARVLNRLALRPTYRLLLSDIEYLRGEYGSK